GGWFTDAECTVAYDFTTAVTEDFTLYAKWNEIWNVTLNYNYGTTPETKVVAVGNGEVMAEPSGLPRAGFYFVGWYDDAAGETAHNFANAVTADATIYAKWASPSKNYGYTATSDGDRWQFRWKGTSVATLATLKPGDTVTFMVKFGTAGGGTAPTSCRIRTANDSSEKSLNLTGIALTPDEAGWCYVTATIPEGTSILGQGILLTIDGTVKIGDTCDIRAIAFNGVEIPVSSSSTSSGLYPGVNASYSFTDI
ncbi:MAG: InlB B-repeat-containing protein, partial [Spirochaetales bacterium]|nr:InlB B-repeat-containing protein [Spirochaetales bacterium]